MQSTRGRRSFTLVLVFGAMIFGMVLAGGANLTPPTSADHRFCRRMKEVEWGSR